MKKLAVVVFAIMLLIGMASPVLASDWDKAGKALTIIEGVRVLTGGKVDLIGKITGIDREPRYVHRGRPASYRAKDYYPCKERVWVPHYTWKRKYIPKHKEYDGHRGYVIIRGHYVRYQVENGGHWEIVHYFSR
ncbi:MAG: hypothetical protein ABIJ41_05480 [Candidatus Omnitrophota bacterium]